MELDFSRLNQLSKLHAITGQEAKSQYAQYSSITKNKNVSDGRTDGLNRLQQTADARRAEIERANAVYMEYQRNIRLSEHLRSEILKGLQRDEPNYTELFLQAAQAISLMCADKAFYLQIFNSCVV